MLQKYLNWALVASCSAFLLAGIYSSRFAKICVIISLTVFILLGFCKNKQFWSWNFFKNSRLNQAIFCFLLISALSTIFSVSPYESQKTLFNRFIMYFLMFFIGRFLGKERGYVRILILALLAGSVIVGAGTIADMIGAGRFIRVHTSFGTLIYASYFLYTLPLFIGFIIFHPSYKVKLSCAFAAGPILISFITHGSRGTWVGLLLSVIMMAVLCWRDKRCLIGLSLFAVLLLFFVPLHSARFLKSADFQFLNRGVGSGEAVNVRFQMWTAAINIFKKYPVLGSGPGSYGTLMYDFYPGHIKGGRKHIHAHNTYFEVLADMGSLGLISFLWVLGVFLRKGFRSVKKYFGFYPVSFMMIFLAVIISDCFVTTILVGFVPGSMFWFLFGLGASVFKPEDIGLGVDQTLAVGVRDNRD